MILRPDGKKLRRRAGFVAGYELEKEGQPAADIVSAFGSELDPAEADSSGTPDVLDLPEAATCMSTRRTPRTSR
jgi:hypothetical protein